MKPLLLMSALFLIPSLASAQLFNAMNGHYYSIYDFPGLSLQQARDVAATQAGYLVAINDLSEQMFLFRHFGTTIGRAWLGLSDAASEGTWIWDSGEPLTFTNWCTGEPNNFNNNQDGANWGINPSCFNAWNDISVVGGTSAPRYVIVEWAPVIDPVTKHGYIKTSQSSLFYARAVAQTFGGHLAAINNVAENSIVANLCPADEYCWIGLTDEVTEGVYVWDNGDPLTYTHWAPGNPYPSSPDQDYVSMLNGFWIDDNPNWGQRGIVEIPFALGIEPENGIGSLLIRNHFGKPGNTYLNAITFAPGVFPNGWLFGLDIGIFDLVGQMSAGVPFIGTLDSTGKSYFYLSTGVPSGLHIYAVGIEIDPATGAVLNASNSIHVVTL